MSRPYRASPKPNDWRKAREERGHNVEQASATIDVDPSTWRGWEAGKHTGPWFGLECYRLLSPVTETPRAA